jgi:hypothetical protein
LVLKDAGSNTFGVYQSNGTTPALISSSSLGQDVSTTANVIFNNGEFSGNLIVDGNLTVSGETTTVTATNLSVSDNMIYMNQAIQTTITNAVGDGTDVVYTTSETHNYSIGMSVTITGVDPSAYNLSNQLITDVGSNSFTIENAATGTYVSGGTARARSNANPDLGFAFGYYDTTYQHGGFFRDATDGYFKAFKGYTPEPDTSAFIDTGDPSFALADIQAATFRGIATTAKYADLAENYTADQTIEPATVVCFGGSAEVTICNHDADRRVAGVVSTNPAYLMNSDCSGNHVVAIALQGRVPCKVVGPIRKGDMMVSAGNGAARAEAEPKIGSVIGKALENFDGESGIIEVLVGRV